MDTLRVGLIGYGRFGKIHADAISSIAGAQVTCICVGSREGAAEAQKGLEIPVYSNYEELLAKEKIDLIDIVSPNYLHAKQTIDAMERGKDVLLEKPIAINIKDASRLLEVQKKTSSRVQVGFDYRYAPFWKSFKSVFDEGSVTHPTFARLESWRGPFRTGSGGWRYDGSRVGHQLLEEAVHYFDLAVWYFGMPDKVSGFTDSQSTWKEGRFATAVVFLEYTNGLKVMISDTLNGVAGQNIVSASGDGAVFGMMHSGIESTEEVAWIRVREKGGGYRAEKLNVVGEVENVTLLIDDFFKRLRRGEEPSVTLEDGFKALSLDLAAISAIQSGVAETVARGPN